MLIEQFQTARRDRSLAVLEGFHAIKHARRFGANINLVVTSDRELLQKLCRSLAPEVEEWLMDQALEVESMVFDKLAPMPPETRVIALAGRPRVAAAELLAQPRPAPLVLLENPSHLGNVGAAIRVAAAAGASGVVTTGPHDPWHPVAIRGAAGLQFALPVARAETADLLSNTGILVGLHPEGEPLTIGTLPPGAVLAFGSERRGLSAELLAMVDRRIAIPMQPGVSSLNLATAVAVVLYAWKLAPEQANA